MYILKLNHYLAVEATAFYRIMRIGTDKVLNLSKPKSFARNFVLTRFEFLDYKVQRVSNYLLVRDTTVHTIYNELSLFYNLNSRHKVMVITTSSLTKFNPFLDL